MTLTNTILDDYYQYCLEKLREVYPNYSYSDIEDTVYDYQRFKLRKISNSKRTLHISSHLGVPLQFQQSYDEITSSIQNGEDLRKYQSRSLKRVDYNDDMLSDWGIQHLHLGNRLETDGFVNRTDELLFIRFTSTKAYILGIFRHGDWAKDDLIEIIHTEWPESIEKFKMNVISLETVISEAQRLEIRKGGINTAIQTNDGTVYMGLGYGITTAGTPVLSRMNGDQVIRNFRIKIETIENNIEQILKQCNINSQKDNLSIGLDLNTQPGRFIYQIKEHQTYFTLD